MGQIADLTNPIDYSVLVEKSVLITGGASGLGASIAAECAKHKARVTIADIQDERGQRYQKELQEHGFAVNFVHTDVTEWPSLVNAFKSAVAFSTSGCIDHVIAVAGVFGAPFQLPDEESSSSSSDAEPQEPTAMKSVLQVNVQGVYFTCKLAEHYLRLQGAPETASGKHKSLIIMGSMGGYIEFPPFVDYPASKWAVRGIFRGIRSQMEDQGIRVNLVAPWFVLTPMTENFAPVFQQHGIRFAEAKDVVSAVLRCALDSAMAGRAIGVGASETFDLRDDLDGYDGGAMTKDFLDREGKEFLAFSALR